MSWRSPPLSKYPSMFVKNKAASALLEKQVYGGRTDVCGGFHLLFLFISCYKFFPKSGFMVGNRKPVLCIPPQVPISSALPGSWAIMFLYCFIIFHRHFLNWCKIRCKLTYPDLPLKINKAGHFSFLRSFIVNIHCCRDIRMPHDFLNNLEIVLVLAKTSAKCMP